MVLHCAACLSRNLPEERFILFTSLTFLQKALYRFCTANIKTASCCFVAVFIPHSHPHVWENEDMLTAGKDAQASLVGAKIVKLPGPVISALRLELAE